MWPIGHLASGALVGRLMNIDSKSGSYVALLIGTIFPDFVDKPLGTLQGVPAYHTVAHSLLTGGLLTSLVYMLSGKDSILRNFAVGYLIHIFGDLLLTFGKWDEPKFFFWPIVRPVNPVSRPIKEYIIDYVFSPWFLFELVLTGLASIPLLKNCGRLKETILTLH